jgi:orotidine-5'-phosphate decarboxylase
LEDLDVNGPLLAPGYGAQGGGPDDIRRLFAGVERLVLPSTSREVLGAGPEPSALREAAARARDALAAVLS